MKHALIFIIQKLNIHARREILKGAISDLPDVNKQEIIESLIAAHCPERHLHKSPKRKTELQKFVQKSAVELIKG